MNSYINNSFNFIYFIFKLKSIFNYLFSLFYFNSLFFNKNI